MREIMMGSFVECPRTNSFNVHAFAFQFFYSEYYFLEQVVWPLLKCELKIYIKNLH